MQHLRVAREAIAALESKRDELRESLRNKSELVARLSAPSVILNDATSISAKMRACFYLRTESTEAAAMVLAQIAKKKGESVLLRHEAAYCLGQMKLEVVIETLMGVLADQTDDDIVRHECAEALGAIGNPVCVELLRKVANDATEPREVRETCDIALDRFKDVISNGKNISAGEEDGFNTVDPAIITDIKGEIPISALEQTLNSDSNKLYERYRAMFSLRNRAINARSEDERTEAVLAISRALMNVKQGALFRHEVAFVLGQLSHESSVPFLKQAMEDLNLHEMVRHESAEALGGIGTDEALKILQQYLSDQQEARIVRESCEVALDAAEYWKQFESKDDS